MPLVLCPTCVSEGDTRREFLYMESIFLLDFRAMVVSHRMSGVQLKLQETT